MIDGQTGGGCWTGRMVRAVAGCVVVAVLTSACGGDDDTATPDPDGDVAAGEVAGTPSASDESATGAASEETSDATSDESPDATSDESPDATSDATSDEGSDDGSSGAPDGAAGDVEVDCPPADAVTTAWGQPVELDEDAAMTGAIGLVFCPYVEVIAPGTTDQWGLEPIGDFFSITMTDQNPVIDDPTSDQVQGLGERATWYPTAGELAVWSSGRGVIVSIPFAPDDVDPFELAAGLAGLALGLDPSGATATPADPDEIAAALAEDAAGCPDPAEVGAAVGGELVLADGAIVQDGEGLCPYLTAGDDPYVLTVNIGLSRDDFYPIEPDEPTEEISGLGERAIWQPGYHLLIVWTSEGGRVSVQVSGTELSDDDERSASIAVAEGLV